MTLARLVLRSLTYHRRTGLAVVFGLAVACSVITGSLVVGDSVRGSLRETALSRLGRTTHALQAPGFFRADLAADVQQALRAEADYRQARIVAAVRARGAAGNDEGAVVPEVTALGIGPGFGELFPDEQPADLAARECLVNDALAHDLGLRAGEGLILTFHRHSALDAGNLFARRALQDTAQSLRLTVRAVLPPGGAGDFRLDAQSRVPRNVFLSREWLAERIGKPAGANVLLAALPPEADAEAVDGVLEAALKRHVSPGDHGLELAENAAQGVVALTAEGMLLNEAHAAAGRAAARRLGARAGRASVYLATTVRDLSAGPGREIAYAVVAGVEALEPFTREGRPVAAPGPGEALLNDWAAEDLGAAPGHRLELRYLAPTDDGAYPEQALQVALTGVVDLAGAAADPDLVPKFEGITDAERMGDWSPPFPVDLTRVTERDEAYWDRHRATPRLFTDLSVPRAMWQSGPRGGESGWVTSLRVAVAEGRAPGEFREALAQELRGRLDPADSGLVFRPVRREALAASTGTSDLGQLFLGLSMFLVFSGAGLAAMLLRLSVQQRASQAGIMLACGLRDAAVRRALLAEGAVLTGLGVLVGVPAGLGYAAGVIHALGSWWAGALGETSALQLHAQGGTLVAGALAGLLVGMAAVLWATRALGRKPALELLAGRQAMAVSVGDRGGRVAVGVMAAGLAAALTLALLAGEALAPQAAFFGLGFSLLVAAIAGLRAALHLSLHRGGACGSLGRLAVRNLSAASGRSVLIFGLLAAATFVIVAVAANARDFSRMDTELRASGAGGFSLLATSSVPVPYDPATPEGRKNLGFTPEEEDALRGAEIISFLAGPGEDISCLNLARATHPRLLGVPAAMIRRGGFSPITQGAAGETAWELLERPLPDGSIPAFGDVDSVRWSLHSGLGGGFTMPGPAGRPVRLTFVGLLPQSIFQSELLISEANFRRIYPPIGAPSYFLIAGAGEGAAAALRSSLGDLGLQVRTTREVLNEYLRVQNTYLSMFLALGGLGLLLGTVGLSVVLLRSALERRGELALAQAIGFGRGRLSGLLLLENLGLLLVAVPAGVVCALVAVGPQLRSVEAQVNWTALAAVLIAVVATGAAACVAATHAALQGRLVDAIRQE